LNSAVPGRWIGPACAVFGVLGFSFKGILIKLAYQWEPPDPVTLLALRMLYSAPFFMVMAWWAGRTSTAPAISGTDWKRLAWLGFIGYYLGSLFDFLGLQYITASLERLVLFLYPTIVVVFSALLYRVRVTRRHVAALLLSYVGISLVFWYDLRVSGDVAATLTGGALVFASAVCYALYLVQAGDLITRLGSMRFIAWAMLGSTVFVLMQFVLTRPLTALFVPAPIHGLVLAMALFCTVLPTWLVAEAIRRIGANGSSLIGSLGPVFTIGFGAALLGESIHALQLAGAAFVVCGVLLVTFKVKVNATAADVNA